MKTYKVYNTDYFDDLIDEVNSHSIYLNRCHMEKIIKLNSGKVWFSMISNLNIESILKYAFDKDDVDMFVKENPELASKNFLIYNPNYIVKDIESEYCVRYSPLQEYRDYRIDKILK